MLRRAARAISVPRHDHLAILLLALAALCLALPTTIAAQDWAGTAGVGIEIRGSGRPVADARVELAWLGGRQLSGPGVMLTDSSGRIEVGELAEGRWLLRVRHPDFMGYDAELEVTRGKKPREARATVTKIGESTTGLQVRYFKVEGLARPTRAASPSERPGAPPAERPAAPPAEPVTEMPVDAPAPRRPAQPAPPATAPEAEPEEPASRPFPEPETARLVPGPNDVPPAPAVSRNVRSARGGGCFDCRPGEWATHTQGEPRPPGGPACPDDLAQLAADISNALAAESGPELERYAGPLLPLDDSLPAARRTLTPLANPYDTGCQILALKLPLGSRLAGLQMELATPKESLPCLPDGECPGRTGRWKVVPRIEHTDFGTIVLGAYEHVEESREFPRLTVYFQPPGDWSP